MVQSSGIKKPVIRRYVSQLDKQGNIINTVNLDEVDEAEKSRLLSIVFSQALARMGYEESKSEMSIA